MPEMTCEELDSDRRTEREMHEVAERLRKQLEGTAWESMLVVGYDAERSPDRPCYWYAGDGEPRFRETTYDVLHDLAVCADWLDWATTRVLMGRDK